MWYLKKVPKIVHFYWGLNKNMSFLRYVSILSFSKMNPEWEVILHVPEVPSRIKPTWNSSEQKGLESEGDYFEKLLGTGIHLKKHNFEEYGISNAIHEVFKNDFLRWVVLSRFGGVWSDTDIIYTKPIDNLKINKDDNSDGDTFLCRYSTGAHAIGFLMSSFNNNFFENIFIKSLNSLNITNYQSIGSVILNRLEPGIEIPFPDLKFIRIHSESVYSIDCNYNNINKFYAPFLELKEPDGLIGYHWYGGSPITQDYESKATEKSYDQYNNLMRVLIDKVYK